MQQLQNFQQMQQMHQMQAAYQQGMAGMGLNVPMNMGPLGMGMNPLAMGTCSVVGSTFRLPLLAVAPCCSHVASPQVDSSRVHCHSCVGDSLSVGQGA